MDVIASRLGCARVIAPCVPSSHCAPVHSLILFIRLYPVLRMKRVGWIFSASTALERDYILSSKEILHMAALQAQGGEFFATARVTVFCAWYTAADGAAAWCLFALFCQAVVSLVADEEGTTSVHFEAFQCSQQARTHRRRTRCSGCCSSLVSTTAGSEALLGGLVRPERRHEVR